MKPVSRSRRMRGWWRRRLPLVIASFTAGAIAPVVLSYLPNGVGNPNAQAQEAQDPSPEPEAIAEPSDPTLAVPGAEQLDGVPGSASDSFTQPDEPDFENTPSSANPDPWQAEDPSFDIPGDADTDSDRWGESSVWQSDEDVEGDTSAPWATEAPAASPDATPWADDALTDDPNATPLTPPGTEMAICTPAAHSPLQDIATQTLEVARWFGQPEALMQSVVQDMGPQIVAQLRVAPWPQISDRARMARVPVMMYHDILPEKEVFFDVTPEEFEEDLQLIRDNGLTPISLDQLVNHLQTGVPLPEKPILLTFDDGYLGHYEYVLPLLRQYGYPGLFSIYTYKVDRDYGRPGLTWEQLQEMAADPLVTIAAHSINHPPDLRELSDADLRQEIVGSRQELEDRLGIPIHYFTYPEGKYDERVAEAVADAGFRAALTMDDLENLTAGESENLLAIARIGQSQLDDMIDIAWGGNPLRRWDSGFDFTAAITPVETVVDDIPLTLITGGRPVTVHADSRYQVPEITADTDIVAAVDGGFFSLEYLDSNQMIGPVFSQSTNEFIPGDRNDIPFLVDRPLVLISADEVRYIPFDPDRHNTLEGIQAEMPDVTDAFVAAAWLVRDGEPQPPESFGSLFDFDAERHRAFWGINQQGQPVIGVSHDFVDSIHLGEILASLGLQDAVMLDSGASTSLSYEGESLVQYEPRPVPHIVGLVAGHADFATTNTPSNCIADRGNAPTE